MKGPGRVFFFFYHHEGRITATRISRSSGPSGATPAFADEAVRTGAAAFCDWRTDAPGVRRLITPADLPAPLRDALDGELFAARSAARRRVPKAPPGFTVELFATGLNMPRVIRVAPNGDIFVAET